jgi:hypothetical protein
LLPTGPWTLEAQKTGQIGNLTSDFNIPTTTLDLSAEISYPRPTVIQKVSTPLNEAFDPTYTSIAAPFTYAGTEYSVILTMGSANDPSTTFPSIISTEDLPEDGAIDKNKIKLQLPTPQSAKISLPLSEGLMRYPSILPSMSREVAELTDMSPVSNEYTLTTSRASNALPPEKMELRTGMVIVSTQSILDQPTTLTHNYLLDSSPTWAVSDEISRLSKAPESSLRQASTGIPGMIPIYHTEKTYSSSRTSGFVDYIQQEGKTSVLYDSYRTFATYTSSSRSHEEISKLESTQGISTTSSTSDAKPSNEDDLTMSRSKGSHYIEKRSLGIVLGSVSGAGIVFCAILILHRPCYRRFRGPRKRMWMSQNPENLNVRKTSFAGHSDQREISRFSVDS